MEKFFRTYKIEFYFGRYINHSLVKEPEDTKIVVSYPLTVDMNVGRSIFGISNVARLVIYGLDRTKRERLSKDRNVQDKYIRMDIKAGYGGNEWLIYRGAIQECYSFRNGGDTEYRTVIDSSDAALDLFLTTSSFAFKEGTDMSTRLSNLNSSLLDIHLGSISPKIKFPEPKRGVNDTGNTLDSMRKLGQIDILNEKGESIGKEDTISIDLGEVNYLRQDSDVLKRLGTLEIDESHGLLGTPVRRNSLVSIDVLFEPAANLNQRCHFTSKTLGMDATYKIMAVQHNGVISGAKCGSLTTRIDMFLETVKFYEVD